MIENISFSQNSFLTVILCKPGLQITQTNVKYRCSEIKLLHMTQNDPLGSAQEFSVSLLTMPIRAGGTAGCDPSDFFASKKNASTLVYGIIDGEVGPVEEYRKEPFKARTCR